MFTYIIRIIKNLVKQKFVDPEKIDRTVHTSLSIKF